MPLSEREQQILQEIEKNLYAQDPAFARDVGRVSPEADERKRLRLGLLMFAAGLVLLFTFFLSRWLIAGVAAFALMVGGIVVMTAALRALLSGRTLGGSDLQKRFGSFKEGWEERLRQRYKRP